MVHQARVVQLRRWTFTTEVVRLDIRLQDTWQGQATSDRRSRREYPLYSFMSALSLTTVPQIWQHIQPGVSGSADIVVELREGQGQLRLRLDFDPERSLKNRASRASMSSVDSSKGGGGPVSSPSRFSLSRRRGAEKDD